MQPEDKYGRQNTRTGGFPWMEDINSGKSQVLVWITFLQGRKDTSPHKSWLTVFGAHQTCLVSFFLLTEH